jgi:hypothetical protein
MRRGGRYGRYPGNGPFRDLPPWQRPGWIYGGGAGWGRYYTDDPTKCARFPWLPRWWWSNPENSSQFPISQPPAPQEREFLEEQKTFLENNIAEIKKRLEELESKSETG